jgi:hypothetical protein
MYVTQRSVCNLIPGNGRRAYEKNDKKITGCEIFFSSVLMLNGCNGEK